MFTGRLRWTEEEMEELHEYFGQQIKEGKNVKEKDAIAGIKKSKKLGRTLHRRRWDIIKAKVNYLLLKTK